MSGLCGFLALVGQRPDEQMLRRMVETLHHRGATGSGVAVTGPCGLAAAHLDLGSGRESVSPLHVRQPLTGRPESDLIDAWITYSGEVYNGSDVRAALSASQVQFDTPSDAETLVRSYVRFGAPNFIKAYRGMFSLAIWDDTRQQLLLARDRLGQRPLFYTQTEEWFVFGSEIKSLLAHPAVTPRLNESRIPHYLAYGYPPAPQTLFEGIHVLSPGHLLVVDMSGEAPVVTLDAYWHPPYPTSGGDRRSDQNIAADLLAHLRGSVRLRVAPGVTTGAFLSGGLDSAAVVALLAEECESTIQTFSVTLTGEDSFDERRFARQVAARFVTDHHEIMLEPDVATLIEELVWYYDQPFGDAAAIPTYLAGQQASNHVPLVFTGDGGNELFAGYGHFRLARLARAYNQLPGVAQRAIGEVFDRLPETVTYAGFVQDASTIIETADQSLSERYLSWVRLVPEQWLTALLGGQREQMVREHYGAYYGHLAGDTEPDVVAQLLDVNLRTYVPDSLLTRIDRCFMAASLQARTPFLDHQLMHFVATIPTRLKLRRSTPKYILKQAMKDILPDNILERKPRGYDLPVDSWFRTRLAAFTRDRLLGPDASTRVIFDSAALNAMLDAHVSGEANLGYALWTLLTFELWMRRYFT